jgi:hypothetical protein
MKKLINKASDYNLLYGYNKFILWFNWYFILRWTKEFRNMKGKKC